jgi:hypothetical protein
MTRKNTRADRFIRSVLSQEPMVDWSYAAQAGEVLANEGYEFTLTTALGLHEFTHEQSGLRVTIQDDSEGGFQWKFSTGERGVSVETLQRALKEEQ